MRYLVGFVLLVASVVGCGSGGNPCDDGNPCTRDIPGSLGCEYFDESRGTPCDLNGVAGRCWVAGICKEDLCVDVNCDDGDICSEDHCDYFTTGQCYYYNAGLRGEPCTRNGLPGVCSNVYCNTFDCADEDCDDGYICTDDWCIVREPIDGARYDECISVPADCGDGNQCTDDSCDPETGCINTPVPDGRGCCLRYEEECGFCIPSCCEWVCVAPGHCQNAVCVG